MAALNIKGFPEPLYEALRQRAARRHRSLAQEVIHLLERQVRSEPLSLLELRGRGREVWRGVEAGCFVAEEPASRDE